MFKNEIIPKVTEVYTISESDQYQYEESPFSFQILTSDGIYPEGFSADKYFEMYVGHGNIWLQQELSFSQLVNCQNAYPNLKSKYSEQDNNMLIGNFEKSEFIHKFQEQEWILEREFGESHSPQFKGKNLWLNSQFTLGLTNRTLRIEYIKISEILAQVSSIFQVLMFIGIIAKMASEAKVIEYMIEIHLKYYYQNMIGKKSWCQSDKFQYSLFKSLKLFIINEYFPNKIEKLIKSKNINNQKHIYEKAYANIYQRTKENMTLEQLYKDILMLKTCVQIIFSEEEYAAIKLTGRYPPLKSDEEKNQQNEDNYEGLNSNRKITQIIPLNDKIQQQIDQNNEYQECSQTFIQNHLEKLDLVDHSEEYSLQIFASQAIYHSQKESSKYRDTTLKIKELVSDKNSIFHHSSFERLAYIVDTYGPRVWGGQPLEMVIDEMVKMGIEDGLDNVYKDPVSNFTKWVRKEESLTLYDPRPFPQKLSMIGLGRSIAGDVKAEVLVVTSFDDLYLKKEQVKGKIVCFSVEYIDYGTTVAYRASGAIEAAKYGAVAVLVRSITPYSIDSPHTGVMNYDSRYSKIPGAAISVEDAHMLLRMAERGQKIVVHLKMDNEFIDGANSFNVIAEIKGTEKPEEIVLFGGHIDSWDTGSQTGANDDGGGFMTCYEALRVIKKLNLRPKRTMRFIAWSGEEQGGDKVGAVQYAQQHENEMNNHILAFESDEGSTTPFGFGFSGNQEAMEIIKYIATNYLDIINCSTINDYGIKVDTHPLYERGVPAMRNLIIDLDEDTHPYYFTTHHSAGDTMDVLDADMLDENVIAIASMMYIIADQEISLPKTEQNLFQNISHGQE